jgi:8-oxo-dGTP pyrophosphatase MutT (NUDIX family)
VSSDDDLRWRRGARHPGGEYVIFKTHFVDATHPPTGKSKRFSLIECVDWVNVIALTPDDRVVLVRQYRAGTDAICLEIPGGMVDEGETPLEAAVRELEEETGYTAREWRLLGSVSPNPAIQSNRLHSFLALGAEATASQRLDTSEVIAIDVVPLADVHAMLRDGGIDHALVVDAFAHLAFSQGPLRAPR